MKWVQKYRGTIVEVICFLFILLFVYAAVSKLLESQMFYDNIRNSPLLGGKTTASVASWLVPTTELCVALLIVRRKTRLHGLYGAFGLMFLFTAYIMAILFFAPYIPCSCGGVISLLSWNQHLVFNIGFLLLAIWAIILSRKARKMYKGIKTMEV